jgi:type I restriction enzyme S subunit
MCDVLPDESGIVLTSRELEEKYNTQMINNQNVPKLRFKEFSGEWKEKKLGEISNEIMYGMNSSAIAFDGENKYLRITDIDESSRTFLPSPLTSPDGKIEEKYKLKDGDIVFTRTGASVGKSYLYKNKDGNLLFAGFLIKFSIVEGSPYFIFSQTLKTSYDKWVQKMSMRSGQPGLNAEEYKELLLKFPSLHEQQQIATFLTAIDTKIEQLTKKQTLLKQYKKGVMQKLFSQELRFKADDGSEFSDWEEKTLGDIGDFKSGTGFPESEQGGDLGVPFFKVSDMNLAGNTFYMKSANHYVTDEQISKLKFKVIKEASIIFAKVGAAIFLERKRIAMTFLIDNNMMAFTPKANLLFMKYVFDTIKLSKFAQVGALPSYNASDLKIIRVKVPSLEEQTKIANFLAFIDTKIDLTTTQLEATKQFKKALLQQMFV